MKKNILLVFVAGLLSLLVSAQPEPHCWTTEHYKEMIQNDPQWVINQQNLETFTQDFIRNNPQVERVGTRTVYIIPVVFHILHNYGNENLSDAQVRRAVYIMTRDYRKRNADTVDIIPIFKPIAADCEIEFRLATIDPDGNCTNGIEHIPTLLTYYANDDSKLNPWPNNKYLNIWTANTLENTGAAAYAHLPGGANSTDGIMCLYNYVGDTLAAGSSGERTLTHEAGHHFNLLHCWGGSNSPGIACGDDMVADTPPSIGWDHCDLAGAVCDPNVIENVQNYMEYSYCDVMFTAGQKARMVATLNSGVSQRNNLWSAGNLAATGTDNLNPAPVCSPVADFKSDYSAACSTTTIHFTDQSWKGEVTSWHWEFPGGNPSSSNVNNPAIDYANPGTYDVKLVVTNSTGTDSIMKSSFVRITGAAVTTPPFVENFDSGPGSFPGADGWIENQDGGITWERAGNVGYSGTSSIKIDNYNNTAGAIDEWITPSMDFTNFTFPITLTFQVANAQRNTLSADELKLYYSLNCGQTWQNGNYAKAGAALRTAGVLVNNFTPSNSSQWRQESVVLNSLQHKSNVRLKFRNTSDRGNNTYLDDINISGVFTGIEDIDNSGSDLSIFPNPTSSTATLQFSIYKASDVVISIKDVIGRTVSTPVSKNYLPGIHLQTLPELSKGIYMVDLTVNNRHYVKKLVVS